ncbi:hypothetical protein R3P38DRAFT_2574849, partial [Favolaschia claudopus]
SAGELYAAAMLSPQRGYPLFWPAPQAHHPNINNGIAIGDVGCVTVEGKFIYLFNVFSPAQGYYDPPGFEPLKLEELNQLNTNSAHLDCDPCCYASAEVEHPKKLTRCREYIFHGTILALPRGSHQQYLLHGIPRLRMYAAENAKSWYQYVVNDLGRKLEHAMGNGSLFNGSLFLVTGHEKARSWGMACYGYGHPDRDQKFSLNLNFRKVPGSNAYGWVNGLPGQRQPLTELMNHDPVDGPLDQTLFLRGWRLTLGPQAWHEVNSSSTERTSSILQPPLSRLRRGKGPHPPLDVTFTSYPPGKVKLPRGLNSRIFASGQNMKL